MGRWCAQRTASPWWPLSKTDWGIWSCRKLRAARLSAENLQLSQGCHMRTCTPEGTWRMRCCCRPRQAKSSRLLSEAPHGVPSTFCALSVPNRIGQSGRRPVGQSGSRAVGQGAVASPKSRRNSQQRDKSSRSLGVTGTKSYVNSDHGGKEIRKEGREGKQKEPKTDWARGWPDSDTCPCLGCRRKARHPVR